VPQDRFLHPRLGHSQKVSALTDLEFRVWIQYQLSADDYGVMRCSAITVQADNDALAERPSADIDTALLKLVELGLLLIFEADRRKFVCQWDWQDFQKVRFPRETFLPLPPENIRLKFSGETSELFLKRIGSITEKSPRAHVREEAKGLRHTANGIRLTANGLEGGAGGNGNGDGCREQFEVFWKAYPRKVGKDKAWQVWHKKHPTSALAAEILAAVVQQSQSSQWLKDDGQYIPHPTTWLSQGRWQDEPTHVQPSGISDRGRRNVASAQLAIEQIQSRKASNDEG